MKTERITIRVSEKEKNEIIVISDKLNMNISEYVYGSLKDRMETDKLNDSQSQFLTLFDTAFKKSIDTYHKHIMLVLNRMDFNSRLLLKQQDIFMQHLKIPQTKEDLSISIIPHPIVEVAQDLVLKEIRSMASKKVS